MAARFHFYLILFVGLLSTGLYTPDLKACETIKRLHQQRHSSGFLSMKSGLQRPETQSFLDSEIYPIRVHGSNETSTVRMERLIQNLESAWERQVIAMGFDAPLGDADAGGNAFYDVYLTSVFNQSAVTVAEPAADVLNGSGAPSFILIDVQTSEDDEKLVIEHEFSHALQFAMDPLASFFLFEASAVYNEAIAYPENLKYEEVLQDYQEWPNAPFFTDGVQWQEQTGVISYYEYGGALFLMYLEETYGVSDGTLVAELWQLGKNTGSDENEPDFLDVLREKELEPRLLLLDFSVWRTLVNIWAQPDEGPQNGAIWSGNSNMARFTLTASGLGDRMSFNLKDQLYNAGCLAFDYFSSGQETTLYLEPFLENEEWISEDLLGLSAAFFDGEEQLISSWKKLPEEISWPFDFTVPYNQYVIFSLCDASGKWDTEDDVIPMGLQLYLGDNLPSQVNDAGYFEEPAVTEPVPGLIEETGCSCDSQTSTPMRLPMLWLFICLAMRRRV